MLAVRGDQLGGQDLGRGAHQRPAEPGLQHAAVDRRGHVGHPIDRRPGRRDQEDDAEADRLGDQQAGEQQGDQLHADRRPGPPAASRDALGPGVGHARVTLASKR
jgi:hypothetical protein